MDTEAQIAEQLRRNMTVTESSAMAPETPQEDTSGAAKALPVELDELTMFKMYGYFMEEYRGSTAANRTQLQYIYDDISKQIGTREYAAVITKINELERRIGTLHSDNRIYKLYQWMCLDRISKNARAEMSLIYE